MPDQPSQRVEKVRAAELAAALSLATDLGMGFPFEHGLHATLMTMCLAELLEVDQDTAWERFYASLLMYAVGATRAGSPMPASPTKSIQTVWTGVGSASTCAVDESRARRATISPVSSQAAARVLVMVPYLRMLRWSRSTLACGSSVMISIR